MTEALVLAESQGRSTLTAAELVARKRLVAQVLDQVFKENVHYGKIPGTPKPSLWKPGAEALLVTFGLAAHLRVEDLSTLDEARYRVLVDVQSINSGLMVGMGVGECSSNEEKYRWRRAVCDEEWEETLDDRRRKKWAKGQGAKPYQIPQIRTSPADQANTVLKMAKKRALVDAALTSTSASDFFDQDLEDLPEGTEPAAPRAVQTPQAKQQPAAAPPAEPATGQTAEGLWNDILRRVGGDESAAHQVLKEITAYPAKEGKYKAFDGCNNYSQLNTPERVGKAARKLAEHPQFGDHVPPPEPPHEREPGED